MDQRRREFLVAGMGIGGTAFAAAQASAAFAASPKLQRDMSNIEGLISVRSFGAAGDGVADDTAAIEAAIKVMKPGSCLYFPGGTYVISTGLSRLPKHCSVYCCEGAWLKRAATAGRVSFFSVSGHNDLVVNLDGNDLIDGQWAGSFGIVSDYSEPAEHVRVHNSRFLNMRTGIRADGARNWQVNSCFFENTENCGILAMSLLGKPVKGNVFSGNIFSRMGDYAIAFSRGEDGPCEISNNIVMGNVARDTQLRTLGHAFGIERVDDGVRRPAVAFNNSYIGNIVEQTIDGGYPQGGIVLGDGCRNSIISGNVLRGHGGTPAEGINCPATKSIQITNNQVAGFSGAGIRIDGASRMLVSGNMIENCGGAGGENAAILISYARGAEDVDISGNFIDCSGIKGATAAIKAHGVAGRVSSNWVIRDNTIIGGTGLGISVAGGGGPLDSVRVANNTVTCDRSEAFAAISLSHVARSDVSGNAVQNASRGLVIANCDGIRVEGNSVSDNRAQPALESCMEIPGSTGIHIADNSFHGGTGSPIKPASLLSQDHANAAVRNCGLITEKSGSTPPIAAGTPIPHGLAFPPACVIVTPIDGAPPGVCVRNIGAKTFTIDYAGGGMHAFYWRAECS
jgi:parallel beta-helix repeat protein